jgi:SAM-dependent methyltransferase
MPVRLSILKIKDYYKQALGDGLREHVLQFDNFLTMLQYRKVYEASLHFLSPEMRVLDWGCGNGHFSHFLNQYNIDTTGYSFEPFPVILEGSTLFHFKEGIAGNPTALPFGDSVFDMVFSIGVLEHVRDSGGSEIGSLTEIHRVLKPGGLFLCFHFPNKYQWIEYFGKFTGLAEHFHRWKYRRRDILNYAKQTGFKIEVLGRYNFLPRNQLRILPRTLTGSGFFACLYECLDRTLSSVFRLFCTNHYFVMRAEKKDVTVFIRPPE